MNNKTKIEDSYATDIRKARRKGVGSTQEFFTPTTLCNHMLDKLNPNIWSDFSKTICEPCAGNGNFIVECIKRRLQFCKTQSDIENALNTIYSVELMADNVAEAKQRYKALIIKAGYKITKKVNDILEYNHVCSDFFKWDFENWCPIKEPSNYKIDPLF